MQPNSGILLRPFRVLFHIQELEVPCIKPKTGSPKSTYEAFSKHYQAELQPTHAVSWVIETAR